jgi:hypothetical protein
MMKRKSRIVALTLFLAILVCVACYWHVIAVYIAPRAVLGNALNQALGLLESRFANSPIHLVAQSLDPEGEQRAALQLEMEQKYLGPVRYDMTLHTQLGPNRVLARGNVITGGKMLDLSLYLDENLTAISSEGLAGGNYYGITYDTFSQDIRSRPILAALIGDSKLREWEDSVSSLADTFSREIRLPEFTAGDIRTALFGALALKPQVQRISTPAGGTVKSEAISFCATGQAIAEMAAPYRDNLSPELLAMVDQWKEDSQAAINVTFLLNKGKLVEIHVNLESSAGNTRIFATIGSDPTTEPLVLDLRTKTGEDVRDTRLQIDTVSNEETYHEKLTITQTRNRERSEFSLDYLFDLSTGETDLTIRCDDHKARLRMNLSGEGDTLTIRTQDLSPLLNLFLKKTLESPAICTLTIAPGAEFATPAYRNLDQWSAEDLLEILAGFGGLLGLKLP